MDKLKSTSDKIIAIRTGNHNNQIIQQLYTDIALLSQSQTQPLIFIPAISYSDVLLQRLLPYVYKLIFIFTTSVTGAGTTSKIWRNLAKGARDIKQSKLTDNETADILQEKILEYINQYFDSHFRDFISKTDAFSSTDKLKKVLRQVEVIIRSNAKADRDNYSDWYGQRKVNCDHLAPIDLAKNRLENYNMIGMPLCWRSPLIRV